MAEELSPIPMWSLPRRISYQPPQRGPKWLQGLNRGMGRMMGMNNTPSPYMDPQEQQAAAQRQKMAMAAVLLSAAGPRPQGTQGVLEPFGQAMQAGQASQQQSMDEALRMRMIQAQLQPQNQDPSAIREMQRLGFPLTPEGFAKYNAAQARPGTTINIGEKLNEPIPLAQLDTVRLPDGTTPPIGTTYAEARAMGAKVQSSAELQRTTQANQALGILNTLEELAIGPDGIFTEIEPGLANRAAAALDFGLNMLTQDDPRASQFSDLSEATLAPFIKFLGESGALASSDVLRAQGLLPRIFPLPDTGEVAKEKIDELRAILTRGIRNMNSGGKSENIPPPPAGFTLDPE